MLALESARLSLRPLIADHLQDLWDKGLTQYDVVKWLTGPTWPADWQTAQENINVKSTTTTDPGLGSFSIFLNNEMIGGVDVTAPGDLKDNPEWPTLGYWLTPAAHGQGYASEAARAAIGHFFAHSSFDVLAARVFKDNTASQRVLAKLGFQQVGECVRFSKPLNEHVENHVLLLPKHRFHASNPL